MTQDKLKVFYDKRMVAHQKSPSPSSYKPAEVVGHWLQHHFHDIEVSEVSPVTPHQVSIAHDWEYVQNILTCKEDNGFGERSADVAASLPWTVGAMMDAARHALEHRVNTCAPVSGFHHAGYESACGFCTFNGLMIAALHLLKAGARRIGILDCDMHYGNGTDDILDRVYPNDGAVRASVGADGCREDRGSPILHYTFGEHYEGMTQNPSTRRRGAEHFLLHLPEIVESMKDCDIILYQAGADPHVDDPYGGLLTDEQLATRDHIVFTTARYMGVPVCWDLAGGYRKDDEGTIAPVLRAHTRTLEACLTAMRFVEPEPAST